MVDPYFDVRISKLQSGETQQKVINENSFGKKLIKTNKKVDGQDLLELSDLRTYFIFYPGGDYLIINRNQDWYQPEIFDQILSTFKFL